ncbi:MAG: hypothetical protein WDO18_17750 [Acidobacteriota bacterium]
MSTYLRIEGVNLDALIFDTQDLNTIRGGSLLLLNVAGDVREILRPEEHEVLIAAASIGLFILPDDGDANAIRQEVDDWILKKYPFATFVVDVVQGDNFPAARSLAHAKNRWRQMQSPSVVYPEPGEREGVCELDKVRPVSVSVNETDAKKGKREQSAASHVRRTYGRTQKQHFYAAQTSLKTLRQFAFGMDEIAGNSPQWGNLHDKIGLLYFDANKIGKQSAECLVAPQRQKAFSDKLRGLQSAFLRTVLQRIQDDPLWLNDNKIRLETLLWGGDETLFVVPAWKAWEFAQWFYDFFAPHARDAELQGVHLTFSGGLVFAHHNSPIHALKDLAKDLAQVVKDTMGKHSGTNHIAYQVLESFDSVGSDLEEFIHSRFRNPMELCLSPEALNALAGGMSRWRETVPRRQLQRQLKAPGESTSLKKLKDVLDTDEAFLVLQGATGPHACWIHMAELWDYVSPEGRKN